MADFFRELEDEVRRDRALDVWKKYQGLIIGVAVLVVLAAIGWRGWQYSKEQQAQQAGARYQAAIEAARGDHPEEALALLQEIEKDGPVGYRQLARFRDAAAQAVPDRDKGVSAYEALAADATLTPLMRDLARLRAALLLADTASRDELKTRLEPLLAPGHVFGGNARELLGLAALKQGDFDGAGRLFDEIVTDRSTPAAQRQRVDIYLALVRGGPVKPIS
jgi:hypothetical protein